MKPSLLNWLLLKRDLPKGSCPRANTHSLESVGSVTEYPGWFPCGFFFFLKKVLFVPLRLSKIKLMDWSVSNPTHNYTQYLTDKKNQEFSWWNKQFLVAEQPVPLCFSPGWVVHMFLAKPSPHPILQRHLYVICGHQLYLH